MKNTTLTPEQVNALQSYMCEQALLWRQLQRTIPGVELASMHICPDSAWISIEHEKQEHKAEQGCLIEVNKVTRLSPACHILVAKI